MGATTFTKSGVVNYAKSRSALAGEAFFNPNFDVEYLVIAGGGGGLFRNNARGTSGGGAGGYRSSVIGESSGGGASAESVLTLEQDTSYSVTVGAGAPASTLTSGLDEGRVGNNSAFSSIVSLGGGGGFNNGYVGNGGAGGSGGGAGGRENRAGGNGEPSQGFDGGSSSPSSDSSFDAGGGGGGAGQPGQDATTTTAGNGGDGVSSSITGLALTRAGGGAATADQNGASSPGSGGGGAANANGQANTGGGGGGANTDNGGAGGSGVVILRYPASVVLSTASGLTGTTTTVGQNKVTQITAGTGNISFTTAGAEAFPEPPDYPAFLSYAPLWLDASDAATITESSGSVSQWDNKGTLENFSQATSADQPTTGANTLNGLNVVDFDLDFLTGNTKSQWKFLHDGTEYFIAFAGKIGNTSNPNLFLTLFGNKGGQNASIGLDFAMDDRDSVPANNRLFFRIAGVSNNSSVLITDNDFLPANTPFVFTSLLDISNVTAADRINYFTNTTEGTVNNTATGGTSTSNPTYEFHIGNNGNNGPFLGYIAELIIVSGADATETNRQTVVNYLNSKWGIF